MFVLVSGDMPVFPSNRTDGELLSYLVDDIMMGLFRGVVSVGEDGGEAGFAIAAEFNDSLFDVMEGGNGVNNDDKGKNTA